MSPILDGETPQIDWPVVAVGDLRLIVRWTFYAQWQLSKRKVDVRKLGDLMTARDPALIDTMVECFAAAVAENYTSNGLPAPSADHWALTISQAAAKQPTVWNDCNRAIWQAVGKARPAAATPAPPEAPQPGQAPITGSTFGPLAPHAMA